MTWDIRVFFAYVVVVLTWSTTPLAIYFSNSSLTFITAVTVRMILALLGFGLLMLVLRKRLVNSPKDWWVFSASALGLFPNMLLVYWAVQYIPSGLMSVLMGIYPFFVGLMSIWILRDNPFTPKKIGALCVAVVGLAVIHYGQLQVGADAVKGVFAVLLACFFWAISVTLVKKMGAHIDPIRHNTGSLLIATPLFFLVWLLVDGQIPTVVDAKSFWAVIYLVVCGSLISHSLYFYVIRHCTVSTVSLITLMTPVLALTWGILFANEVLSQPLIIGAAFIFVGLGAYLNLGLIGSVAQRAYGRIKSFI